MHYDKYFTRFVNVGFYFFNLKDNTDQIKMMRGLLTVVTDPQMTRIYRWMTTTTTIHSKIDGAENEMNISKTS